jgi:hypothetical protein
VDRRKLKVVRNVPTASRLPIAETVAETGRRAIITPVAISTHPSRFEKAWTLQIPYTRLINGLWDTRG